MCIHIYICIYAYVYIYMYIPIYIIYTLGGIFWDRCFWWNLHQRFVDHVPIKATNNFFHTIYFLSLVAWSRSFFGNKNRFPCNSFMEKTHETSDANGKKHEKFTKQLGSASQSLPQNSASLGFGAFFSATLGSLHVISCFHVQIMPFSWSDYTMSC